MWRFNYEGCLGNQTEGVSTETAAGRGEDTEECSGKVRTCRTSHFLAFVNQKNSLQWPTRYLQYNFVAQKMS